MTTRPIRLKPSPLSCALLATMLVSASGAALAQEEQEASETRTQEQATTPAQTSNLDTVQVVGSRIKRSEIEGPAPVTVISREDIDREGVETAGDMLRALSQILTWSFAGDLVVTGFTPNAQLGILRILGAGYTLTLLNGRRPAQQPQPYNRDN